ncbi:MAG: BMP family ABC transporter substrate-binding protein [Lachnospiraceae bacterium]|nr:BMP family ABC transporter substrate-binding protein [Lachnospiraceae bacterium]
MKNKELFTRLAFLALSILLVLGIIYLIFSFRPESESSAISVGAVFIGSSDDDGWNESHYKGIIKACEDQSCHVTAKFNVPEEAGPLGKAVSELVSKGCSCIFLTSYGYGLCIDPIAAKYPNVAFYDICGESDEKNCMSYFARMYQVRYLAGIVAGSVTQSDVLGYVTAMPVPETIRSVNAYAMGVHRVNPSAKVIVNYTNSWDDREMEERAVKNLSAAGADLITFHEDRAYALDLADEMGLYSTGYNFVYKDYSDKMLTAALINWDYIYGKVLSDYLSGRANFSHNYWLGIDDNAVSLYPCSDLVTADTRSLVEAESERISGWKDVFSGEIYDNKGNMRCGENERISDEELFYYMDWYVEGVEVYE